MDRATKNLRKIAQDPNYAKILSGINSRIVTNDDFQKVFDDYFVQKKLLQETNSSLSDDGLFIETSSVAKYTGYGIQTMVIRLYKHDLNFGDIPTYLVVVISTSLAPIGQGFAFAAFTDDIEMIAGGVGFKHYFNDKGIEVGLGLDETSNVVSLDSPKLNERFTTINVLEF
ncbi:hypothetical protein K1728_00720 [Weissella confusa]|uniref:hypothetical protein n=1 Tax=Weissella confusa TaxID=1583 RepID=UPI001C6F8FEC|nr:hypothetical protein [Weissella confusa]QYU57968.1 hypothetical protein K1728_00720 [Weissella confusa]